MADAELIVELRNTDAERQYIREAKLVLQGERSHAADRIEALNSQCDALREAIAYVLDGYGLNAPDYRFQDGEEGDWITDRLVFALTGKNYE